MLFTFKVKFRSKINYFFLICKLFHLSKRLKTLTYIPKFPAYCNKLKAEFE